MNKKNTILIVDDEPKIRRLLKMSLESQQYRTDESETGEQAIRMALSLKPDLVLLDLGLPDMDGKEVIRAIKKEAKIPIIICSVRNDDKEVISSLNIGADDYITKPFNPGILVARVQSNLRKAAIKEAGTTQLQNGDIIMDLVRHEVFVKEKRCVLTPKEYQLLRYFLINRGKMITHAQILKDLWGPAHGSDMQYLRVYVRQLRDKIERNSKDPLYIMTEPGIGYRMDVISAATRH